MGLFDTFRTIPYPTLYGENRSAVSADLIVAGLITAFGMIFVSFLIGIFPGAPGLVRKFSIFIRVFVSLFIGCSILVCEFGDGWRVDEKHAHMYLKQPFLGTRNLSVHANSPEFEGYIGVHVGLHGVNITLKGSPTKQTVAGALEEINYNSHFDYGILQGRLGFGPQAGLASQQFRDAQYRGAPLPILWVAEYFTLDGEDIRWGRNFRQAGYYTSLLLWTAFAWWILAVFILTVALPYGAIFLAITGLTLIVACIVFATMHDAHGPPFRIPIADGVVLDPSYGWSFILILFNGILCLILSFTIYFLYLRFPEILYSFFNLDVLEEEDLLEVQRGIDIDSGYLCTWDEQKEEPDIVEASGDIKKVPLQGGVSADVEAGSQSNHRNGSTRQENFAELRKSRRSHRKKKRAVSFNGDEADPMTTDENGIEMKKMSQDSQPSGLAEVQSPAGGLTLSNALKASVTRHVKKSSSKRKQGRNVSPSGDALVTANDGAEDLQTSKNGANELLVPTEDEPEKPEMV